MAVVPELAAASTLGAAATQVEQSFIAIGRYLEDAIGILDRLSHRFAEYTAELSGAALLDTGDQLASASRQLAELVDVRRADAMVLASLDEITTTICGRIGALEVVTREIEALSVNARVIAGSIGATAADFGIFAQNMRRAAEHVRDSLSEARNALGDVRQELAAAGTDAAAFRHRHQSTMQAIPARLAGNLSSLATERQLATDAANAAQCQSTTVRQQVAEQIVALQLGDIVRQRIEHVQAALQFLLEPSYQAGSLLAAQLNDAADDLAHEGRRIETGLRQLAEAARAIGQLGVKLHGETQAYSGGFIATLEADIHQTAELFTVMSADDVITDRRMAEFLVAADMLGARLANVQSVQEDLRIMGLNATLKCNRLGAVGRPLAAVAQELRSCSGRFGSGATTILLALDRLRPLAADLRDPERCAKHATLAQAAKDMLVALQRLHRLQQELAVALSELQQDAGAVGRLVEDAVSGFAVRHVLETALRQTASELTTWAAAAGQGRDEETHEVLDRIASAYTMDRERAVHVRFAPLPMMEATTGPDDILF